MKSPRVSANVKIDPATMPGSASGSTTRQVVPKAGAPRSADASSRLFGIRSSAPNTGMIMYGSQM